MGIDEQPLVLDVDSDELKDAYEPPLASTIGPAAKLTLGPTNSVVPDNPNANQGFKSTK